ncbi:hypothetical protein GUJ93_ZPchr0586g11355, partial [Zizania palustris]
YTWLSSSVLLRLSQSAKLPPCAGGPWPGGGSAPVCPATGQVDNRLTRRARSPQGRHDGLTICIIRLEFSANMAMA